jgi:DNA replication protein DnaC
VAYDAHAADLLFQVVSRRYEQKSILITTNLPFKQWDTVFPNAACAVALIDRLTHHTEIVSIDNVISWPIGPPSARACRRHTASCSS